MKEFFPSPEPGEKIKREQVIDGYKKFIERGIRNPDDLDLNDPEVKKANDLFYKWHAQEDVKAEGNEEIRHLTNLSKTILYVDAGFTDPIYLNEVLHEWLIQDAQSAEKRSNNLERAEIRQQIASAMKKIRGILGQQQ